MLSVEPGCLLIDVCFTDLACDVQHALAVNMLHLRCAGRLATDTVHIRGAVGDALGLLVQNLVTIIAAYVRP